MGLPASGQISMDDIRVELGVPTQSPFSLDAARAGTYVTLNTNSPSLPPSTGQVSLADWYEYCQNCDTYYLSYASTQAIACENNDAIQVISNTIPIGVGSLLTYADGSQSPCDYYFSDGTNWYYVTCTDSETSEVTSTGTCAVTSSLFYVQNSSLDIVVNDVKVNGVSLTGVTGTGFPLLTGDTVTGYSNQIGTYDVEILYYVGVAGQHFDVYDSDLTFTCVGTIGASTTNTATIYSAVVGAGTFQIYAYDGVC
jgi:hypothetical protein